MFFGSFESKKDICEQFGIPDFEGIVLFAVYDNEDYEGYAEVIFVQDGKIYMVSGSHCSCYGLENQWEPIEMSIDGLRRIIEKGSGLIARYGKNLSEGLDMINILNLEGASSDNVYIALKLAFG